MKLCKQGQDNGTDSFNEAKRFVALLGAYRTELFDHAGVHTESPFDPRSDLAAFAGGVGVGAAAGFCTCFNVSTCQSATSFCFDNVWPLVQPYLG
jgi:hypothetical protein